MPSAKLIAVAAARRDSDHPDVVRERLRHLKPELRVPVPPVGRSAAPAAAPLSAERRLQFRRTALAVLAVGIAETSGLGKPRIRPKLP